MLLFRKCEENMPLLLQAAPCFNGGVTAAQAGWLYVSRISRSRTA